MPYDVWCRISVDGPIELDELRSLVASITQAAQDGEILSLDEMEIDVSSNSDYDAAQACEFPDGFLFFRHHVYFYTDRPTDQELIARVLAALWGQGLAAVAGCDFEHELPHAGGYKSPDVPWPGRGNSL